MLRRFGYQGKIISFEPLKKEKDILDVNMAEDENFESYNYAIGTLNVMLKNFYLMLNNDMKTALRGLVFCDYNRFVYATAPPILIQTE